MIIKDFGLKNYFLPKNPLILNEKSTELTFFSENPWILCYFLYL